MLRNKHLVIQKMIPNSGTHLWAPWAEKVTAFSWRCEGAEGDRKGEGKKFFTIGAMVSKKTLFFWGKKVAAKCHAHSSPCPWISRPYQSVRKRIHKKLSMYKQFNDPCDDVLMLKTGPSIYHLETWVCPTSWWLLNLFGMLRTVFYECTNHPCPLCYLR